MLAEAPGSRYVRNERPIYMRFILLCFFERMFFNYFFIRPIFCLICFILCTVPHFFHNVIYDFRYFGRYAVLAQNFGRIRRVGAKLWQNTACRHKTLAK